MIEWIDVKKELPPYSMNVLVALPMDGGGYMYAFAYRIREHVQDIAYFDSWFDFVDDDKTYEMNQVTHWAHINAPEIGGGHHG